MREYFWHILITLGLFVVIIFGATALSLRFSNQITYTDSIAVSTPSVTIVDPQIGGGEETSVTVVTYSDYACSGCASVEEILMEILQKNPDKLRIVWKDMPNETRHSEAFPAAVAARCAGKQGKFWEFNALLFANQSRLGKDLYQSIASEVGLDTPTFSSCFENEDTRPLVERTLAEGFALEVTATPTLFINGERFTGSLSKAEIEKVLNAAMKK
ncbi:DsbA family protein [bacterium]|jgi:protein-disulfide isomerase|nr:DsbA family protein [bacterium]NBX49035.1 DsbA family protein [bacterium]